MKLKTEQEIRLSALHIYKYSTPETSKMFSVQDYCAGYTQAQQYLISQASEGFDEHLFSMGVEAFVEEGKDSVNLARYFWQASSLANAKNMQEKDAEIERLKKENEELKKENKFQVDVMCDMGEVVIENEKLQKENEELKEDIKKLLDVREILRSKSVSMRAFAIIDRVFNPIKDKWLKGEV